MPDSSPTDPAIPARLEQLLPILACPVCRGRLLARGNVLACSGCDATYPIRNGVPILLPGGIGGEPGEFGSGDDRVSRHPYAPHSETLIEKCAPDWVLDLGAGGKLERREHVVQMDIFRYPMTDVVGSADCLPFQNNAFAGVVSQAVFEHLKYPEQAAAEIRRVLKPGGQAKIDTAFLQPEHGYPHHYYNATEAGLLHWFRHFDIEWHGIEPYQHPVWSLHWFLGVYLSHLPTAEAVRLGKLTLAELLASLDRLAAGEGSPLDQAIHAALLSLPTDQLRTLAAGVSVLARNPATPPRDGRGENASGLSTQNELLRLEARLSQLENALQYSREDLTAAREQMELMADTYRFLEQYLPRLDQLENLQQQATNPGGRLCLRILAQRIAMRLGLAQAAISPTVQPAPQTSQGVHTSGSVGFNPRAVTDHSAWRHVWGHGKRPFVTWLLKPETPIGLIKTVFSLVRQTYSAWQLILLADTVRNLELQRVMRDLQKLDERIRILEGSGPAYADIAKGHFIAWLQDGGTLAFRATEILFTQYQATPDAQILYADQDRMPDSQNPSIRCHHSGMITIPPPPDAHGWSLRLDRHFLDAESERQAEQDAELRTIREVHLPVSLYHLREPGNG